MRGRQRGRPTKLAYARLNGAIDLGKAGVTFEVWNKWKKGRPSKHGTLTVSVGGLRWWPVNAQRARRVSWNAFDRWVMEG
jgi:hypothetical protein